MLKKLVTLILFCMFAFITLLCLDSDAATFGQQDIRFLAAGENLILLAEDIGGEYQLSRMLTLVTAGEEAAVGSIELESYGQWESVGELIEQTRRFPAVALERDGAVFSTPDGRVSVEAPEANKKAGEAFQEFIARGGSGAVDWNEQVGTRDMPLVNGDEAEALYAYPRGLYINYGIERAWYLPRSGHLLVITNQKSRAVGMDTMHGFVLIGVD